MNKTVALTITFSKFSPLSTLVLVAVAVVLVPSSQSWFLINKLTSTWSFLSNIFRSAAWSQRRYPQAHYLSPSKIAISSYKTLPWYLQIRFSSILYHTHFYVYLEGSRRLTNKSLQRCMGKLQLSECAYLLTFIVLNVTHKWNCLLNSYIILESYLFISLLKRVWMINRFVG